jgi:hypothetical protein
MDWIRPAIAIALFVLPFVAGVVLWHHSKGRPGTLVLVLLGALVVGAVLAGAYMLFDTWLVTRKQGHF